MVAPPSLAGADLSGTICRGRSGPMLCAGCCLWAILVPKSVLRLTGRGRALARPSFCRFGADLDNAYPELACVRTAGEKPKSRFVQPQRRAIEDHFRIRARFQDFVICPHEVRSIADPNIYAAIGRTKADPDVVAMQPTEHSPEVESRHYRLWLLHFHFGYSYTRSSAPRTWGPRGTAAWSGLLSSGHRCRRRRSKVHCQRTAFYRSIGATA